MIFTRNECGQYAYVGRKHRLYWIRPRLYCDGQVVGIIIGRPTFPTDEHTMPLQPITYDAYTNCAGEKIVEIIDGVYALCLCNNYTTTHWITPSKRGSLSKTLNDLRKEMFFSAVKVMESLDFIANSIPFPFAEKDDVYKKFVRAKNFLQTLQAVYGGSAMPIPQTLFDAIYIACAYGRESNNYNIPAARILAQAWRHACDNAIVIPIATEDYYHMEDNMTF